MYGKEGNEMNFKVGVIAGDGIGPEVTAEATKVLGAVGQKYGHTFEYTEILMGGCSIDATGVPLTDEAIADAKSADAVLMGSSEIPPIGSQGADVRVPYRISSLPKTKESR